jgi:dolichol kinase
VSGTGTPAAVAQLDYRGEVWRKLLHLFALVIPIGYHIAPRHIALAAILIAFLFSLFADICRLRRWGVQRYWTPVTDYIVRPKESSGFTGATHILFSGFLCLLLFSLPAATLAMSTIILGDAAAALVGRKWGRHKFTHANRSWEGSLSFLASSLIAAFIIPGLPLWIGFTGSVIGTLVEAFSNKIDDNLSVPLVVGLFAHLAMVLTTTH